MKNSMPIIDLFSGAGGLGIGALRAGGDLRLSVDNDRLSCETMRANPSLHSGAVLQADVTQLKARDLRKAAGLSASEEVIVVGGAPCQPFSKAAYWVDKGDEAAYRRARARGESAERSAEPLLARPDSRRTLVNEFWRLTRDSNAAGFVFENVPSILHPRNKHVFEALKADAEKAGYFTRTVVATATDFGVPQARQRVFLLGSLERQPEAPVPTHAKDTSEGKLPWVTSGQALRHLEGPEFAEGDESIEGTWADHLRVIPPGMNYKFHTAWAGHPNPTFETETRYWNFLLKLDPDRPSWTIPASPGPWTGPFHWSGRRLRISELAALQTFPEGYSFVGPRREQIRQIGNAVPSLMAEQMVQSVLGSVSAARKAA